MAVDELSAPESLAFKQNDDHNIAGSYITVPDENWIRHFAVAKESILNFGSRSSCNNLGAAHLWYWHLINEELYWQGGFALAMLMIITVVTRKHFHSFMYSAPNLNSPFKAKKIGSLILQPEKAEFLKYSKKNANSTPCSQAVTHPSTDGARRCLTSVIGRELVYSAWYGRWQR